MTFHFPSKICSHTFPFPLSFPIHILLKPNISLAELNTNDVSKLLGGCSSYPLYRIYFCLMSKTLSKFLLEMHLIKKIACCKTTNRTMLELLPQGRRKRYPILFRQGRQSTTQLDKASPHG